MPYGPLGVMLAFGSAMLFLTGLLAMSQGLGALAGSRLAGYLTRWTRSPFPGFLCGALLTAVVQSSSAVNASTLGLLTAGILQPVGALAVILGANVGTTLTAQLVASPLSQMGLPTFAAGVLWWIFASRPSGKAAALALTGLGGMLTGLQLLGWWLVPFSGAPWAASALLLAKESPWYALAAGAGLTLFVQSSSAVTSLTVHLTDQRLLDLATAVAITLGANVGTVGTTLLASLVSNEQGKRLAVVDLIYNLVGAVLALICFPWFLALCAASSASLPRQVANAHTLFNVLSALAAFPLLGIVANWVSRGNPSGSNGSGREPRR